MKNWMQNWQPYIESYMKKIEYTYVFDTEKKDVEEVLKEVTKWLKERL